MNISKIKEIRENAVITRKHQMTRLRKDPAAKMELPCEGLKEFTEQSIELCDMLLKIRSLIPDDKEKKSPPSSQDKITYPGDPQPTCKECEHDTTCVACKCQICRLYAPKSSKPKAGISMRCSNCLNVNCTNRRYTFKDKNDVCVARSNFEAKD